MQILLPFASASGSTAEIAAYMAQILNRHALTTTLVNVSEVRDIGPYDVIMPGAPIHTGMWIEPMLKFIQRHYVPLQQKTIFPWLTCVRVLEPDGYQHALQHYLPPALVRFPGLMDIGVFAGKLNAPKLANEERWQYVLRYDGTGTLNWMNGDFRDWDKIQAWTELVAAKLNNRSAAHVQ